jgi:5-methylcytosine-specific restriction endonuclease McrA
MLNVKSVTKAHRSTYYKEHYAKYGELYRARAKLRKMKIIGEYHRRMLEYLRQKSCMVCGETDPIVLEFDHPDPARKNFGIARAISDLKPWAKILAEMQACQVLCANCHKRKTAREFSWYKNSAESKNSTRQ